ncbi:hypothetical protein SESBI_41518 [Sesbania bispinosa]|nr:hypothetical protein SESBI_41518 [Sesbania bispinosa]
MMRCDSQSQWVVGDHQYFTALVTRVVLTASSMSKNKLAIAPTTGVEWKEKLLKRLQ